MLIYSFSFIFQIKMRRGSLTPLTSQSSCGEPVIVVDDTSGTIEEEPFDTDDSGAKGYSSQQQSLDLESPTACNPYLLSPWRDPRETRKHSLPTPQCTGITASQVNNIGICYQYTDLLMYLFIGIWLIGSIS